MAGKSRLELRWESRSHKSTTCRWGSQVRANAPALRTAQEKEAMDRLGTIEKQKKLIAAFRERKLPVSFISVLSRGTVGC
jgi:hypothetical protein